MSERHTSTSIDSIPHPPKVPGRTLGFSLMTTLIVLVSIWMYRQGELRDAESTEYGAPEFTALEGFNENAWFLAADSDYGFVEIAAGPFTMGSNPAVDRMAYENERWSTSRRQGEVELPNYLINKFEVTVAQFSVFVNTTGARTSANLDEVPADFPVTNITWTEALAYARWLDQQLRHSEQTPEPIRRLLQNGGQLTLPTEAEWEKAARGTSARIFPWGNELTTEFANFDATELRAVGSISCPNCSYGLADMSGNVWEFTRSPLRDYPYDSELKLDTLEQDPIWVMRGGSYADAINNVRAATRGGVDPGVRSPGIGFRVVISSL